MPGAFNEEPLTPGASSERAASIMKTLQLSLPCDPVTAL
jgi:hypothetical protein